MGIPGLFYQFIKNIKGVIVGKFPVFVSSLALDLNGVFHEARNNVLGAYTTDKEVLNAISRTSSEQIDLEIRIEILRIIMDVINKIKPRDTLLLCVDGPAPHAKLQQQKIRRQGSIPNPKFDGNAITPGTDFMMRLHDNLIVFIERNKDLLPPKVIYSSHLVTGEGEHKIMDYYRGKEVSTGLAAKKGGSHFIYGLDSDLIMLSLVSPLRNIFLYQERPELDYKSQIYSNKRYIININSIKNYLMNKRKNSIVINDFVVMCFLIGNDFLPHFPIFKDIGNALLEFVDIYFENNFVLTDVDEDGDPCINWVGFGEFIGILASREYKKLVKLARKNDSLKYPSRIIENSIIKDEEGDDVLSYDTYRYIWYNNALGSLKEPELAEELKLILGEDVGVVDSSDINKMVDNYLLLISWNYLYYTKGTSAINMDLSYVYHHSPMLIDINLVLNYPELKVVGYKSKDEKIKFTALHQLVAVMPLRSKDLLPTELKPLFSYNSIIRDIFPDDFITEMDGIEKETQKHQGLAIIPFVDRKRIYDAVFQLNFTAERAKLWLPQKDQKSERTESIEEKSARELAFSEYKSIKESFFTKKPQTEVANINTSISVKQVPISKENIAIVGYSEILSSFGIELGTNSSVDKFIPNNNISFISNKINEPNITKNKLIPTSKKTTSIENQPIARSRVQPTSIENQPIARSRVQPTSIENQPIARSRVQPTSIENQPIARSRVQPTSIENQPILSPQIKTETGIQSKRIINTGNVIGKTNLLPVPLSKKSNLKPI